MHIKYKPDEKQSFLIKATETAGKDLKLIAHLAGRRKFIYRKMKKGGNLYEMSKLRS